MIVQFALYFLFHHCLERTLCERVIDLVTGNDRGWVMVGSRPLSWHSQIQQRKQSAQQKIVTSTPRYPFPFFPLAKINPFTRALSKLCFWPPG
jgi:hypothetical protein